MITAGVDAGLDCTKAVLLDEEGVLSYSVLPGGREATTAVAEQALNQAMEKAGISAKDVNCIVATGMGRIYIPFARDKQPEFLCLAKGATWLYPSTKTALDIGAEKSLAVKCRQGRPMGFASNDRCASGCGRYLEMLAKILELELEEIGPVSLHSREVVEVKSQCAVFAESEIISLIHMKKKPEDILRGVYRGLILLTYPLLAKVGLEKDLVLAGGVARNIGVVKALEEQVNFKVLVPENPEIVGALGAALVAKEKKETGK